MVQSDGPRNGGRATAVFATVCLLLAATARPANGYRVLAFETVAARSHWNFMKGVLLALANGGHRVTVYTPFPDRGAPDASTGYTEVDTSADFDTDATVVSMNATETVPLFSNSSYMIPFLGELSRFACDLMDELLADRGAGEFDVFITEPLTDECSSHVAVRLGVPLIYTVPAPLMPWIETGVFGHVVSPAYGPHMLSGHSTVDDTFYGRLSSVAMLVRTVYEHYRFAWAASARDDRPYDRVPPVKPAVTFVNTHYVTELSRPVPVNRVDVGGIHLRKPNPLPADILDFIENSPRGIILLSFGTVVTLSSLPDNIQKSFKDAIAEVPQRVLIKYDGEMHNKPKNVMTSKWLPQRDILLHPKVKLFIGHGGISGVYEVVDAGVPFIGFPLFYDQPRNVDSLVNAGMAISLDLFSVTKHTLLDAINKIVNNKTYAQNAKTVSELFKDRPISSAESVAYWTEYVVHHNGAFHLKSDVLNSTWCQHYLLDIVAFILLNTVISYYVLGYVCYVTQYVKTSIRKCLKKSFQV